MEEQAFRKNEGEHNKYILSGVILLLVVLMTTFFLKKDKPLLSEEKLDLANKALPYESAEGRVLPFHSIGPSGYPKATFGVGCFWSGEQEFQSIPGLIAAHVGYVGGDGKTKPTYEHVKANTKDYVEVVTMEYDPDIISYKDLLKQFWEMHDPTPTKYTETQYRSAVFYHSPKQKMLALKAKEELQQSGLYGDFEIVTDIDPGSIFYLAEEKHQNYYSKNERKTFLGGH